MGLLSRHAGARRAAAPVPRVQATHVGASLAALLCRIGASQAPDRALKGNLCLAAGALQSPRRSLQGLFRQGWRRPEIAAARLPLWKPRSEGRADSRGHSPHQLSSPGIAVPVGQVLHLALERQSRGLLKQCQSTMEPSEKYLFKHKGTYFQADLVTKEYIDSLEDFKIRDSDVFLVTYPKSGTVWTQQILSLIYHEGHRDGTDNTNLGDLVPWLEYKDTKMDYDYVSRPSPRLFCTHLPYYLVPKELRNGRTKLIYVVRNPKDVLVSYYHYSKFSKRLEEIKDFDFFMERFLNGKVLPGLWLDHVEGWYAHRDDFNIIFLTYEEMKKDLRGAVLKICNFLGKRLTEKVLGEVVDKATFEKMRLDHRSNYENLPDDVDISKGRFLRKGTVGDWKSTMTVAQSERFDSVFKERMEKLPFKFCWDINDEH